MMSLNELRKSSGRSIEEVEILRSLASIEPRVSKVELIERYSYKRDGVSQVLSSTYWDVMVNGRSRTDDYGIQDAEEAKNFYQYTIAYERGDFDSMPKSRVVESIDVLRP